MLFNHLLTQKLINFFQSSFYYDYIIKKISEVFVKNIFIYSSLFFGEKYMIEFLTKKIIDNIIIVFNNNYFNNSFSFNFFFLQVIFFFFSFIFLLNIYLIFFF